MGGPDRTTKIHLQVFKELVAIDRHRRSTGRTRVPLVGMMNDFPGPALAQRHYANK
jgi:hypothetical protein